MKNLFKILIISIMTINTAISIPDNIFGTDGIRSQVGVYPLDQDSIIKLGNAIGLWAKEKYGNKNIKLLIAQDTRISCPEIIDLLTPGLLKNKIIINNAGIIPTPTAVFLSKDYDFTMIISASHNPARDNGIKIIDNGNKLSESDEKKITELFYKSIDKKTNIYDSYINYVLEKFNKLDLRSFKIVIDTANGAQYKIAPEIFKKLGADIIVINNCPDGNNINLNCGSTHPELLQELVIKSHSDIGFAFDGDGDRVIAVDDRGDIKDGDDILALLSNNPDYKDNEYVVSTILANYGLETYLTSQKKSLIRTNVGDKYIARELKNINSFLGGEPSGHIILNNIVNSGDGIIVALKVLETLLENNKEFISYKKYSQTNINIPIKTKKDLTITPLKEILDEAKNKIDGRLVVRYSGTENLLRVMAESLNQEETNKITENLVNKLKEHLA